MLYYFFGIKRKFSTTFYLQTDSKIKKQKIMIKAYFQAFVNFEQNDWTWLLFMAKFAYNNTKNASIGHTSFELNCGYYSKVFYKKDLDFHLKFKTIKKLSFEF